MQARRLAASLTLAACGCGGASGTEHANFDAASDAPADADADAIDTTPSPTIVSDANDDAPFVVEPGDPTSSFTAGGCSVRVDACPRASPTAAATVDRWMRSIASFCMPAWIGDCGTMVVFFSTGGGCPTSLQWLGIPSKAFADCVAAHLELGRCSAAEMLDAPRYATSLCPK